MTPRIEDLPTIKLPDARERISTQLRLALPNLSLEDHHAAVDRVAGVVELYVIKAQRFDSVFELLGNFTDERVDLIAAARDIVESAAALQRRCAEFEERLRKVPTFYQKVAREPAPESAPEPDVKEVERSIASTVKELVHGMNGGRS